MTRIVLIQPDSPWAIDPLASHPALGLLYISAYLKANGFQDVEVIDLTGGVDLWHFPSFLHADIIGITATTPHFPIAMQLRRKIAELNRDATFVIGGPHATVHPESCIDAGFDVAVQGEGEKTMVSIARAHSMLPRMFKEDFRLWNIANRFFRDEPILDLDSLPFPDRDAIDIHRYKYVKDGIRYTDMICSRGCLWGKCAFCCQTWSKPARFRTPENCIEEMKIVRDRYGFEGIYFYDDCFNLNRPWLRRFCELAQPLEMKWRCLIRADVTRSQVKEMKDAGCVEVFIGQESGSDPVLKNIDKGITAGQGLEAVEICTEAGLNVRVGLIVGLPGESRETVEETREWLKTARKIDPDLGFDYTICTVYPGSPIWTNPERYDITFEKTDWSRMIYKRPVGSYEGIVSTSHLSAEEILSLQREVEEEFESWGSRLMKG